MTDKSNTTFDLSYLIINLIFSMLSCVFMIKFIPHLMDMFIKANLFGIDVHKRKKVKLPEAMGVVAGCIYLITLFLFIPVPFSKHIADVRYFPHNEFVEVIAALLSICCMLLLGFADDVLDLRWRHKLILPTIASLPLLAVYFININSTTVIIPKPLHGLCGSSVNLGVFYYIYMGMLAVFCTNAINILAGINGLEVGQSLVIACSVVVFNILELNQLPKFHTLSLYFMIPFIAVSFALLVYNWCPAKVLVGDTYCYFAGMTFAVVGILGHFSKTVILFFIPQIFNFLYSVPQLFHAVPCPRHRMPVLNEKGMLEASYAEFTHDEVSSVGKVCLNVFKFLRLIDISVTKSNKIRCNNFTIINLMLIRCGPLHEQTLTTYLLMIQILCSVIAFGIRYPLASLFYDVD